MRQTRTSAPYPARPAATTFPVGAPSLPAPSEPDDQAQHPSPPRVDCPSPPRDLTATERQVLARAQAELTQKQLNNAGQREFERQLRENTQPRLFPEASAGQGLASRFAAMGSAALQKVARPVLPPPPPVPTLEAPSRPSQAETGIQASFGNFRTLSPRVQDAVAASMQRLRTQPRVASTSVPAERAAAALEAAEPILCEKVRPRARERARIVLRALYEATYTLIEYRRQSEHTTSYTWFTVLDVLRAVTGLSVSTCERATHDLREAGLIATWSSWTTAEFLDQETGELAPRRVRQGVWLAVVLRPRPGYRAMVLPDELPQESPRDLTADRRAGRTGYQLVQEYQAEQEVKESVPLQEGKSGISLLLTWALPEKPKSIPVKRTDSLTSTAELFTHAAGPRDVIWSLSAVMAEHPQRRRETIQAAGAALARLFRDEQSERMYFRFLWRATDAEFAGQPAYMQLQNAMSQVLTDMDELPIRRPGARLRAKLRAQGWLDAVDYRGRPRLPASA